MERSPSEAVERFVAWKEMSRGLFGPFQTDWWSSFRPTPGKGEFVWARAVEVDEPTESHAAAPRNSNETDLILLTRDMPESRL